VFTLLRTSVAARERQTADILMRLLHQVRTLVERDTGQAAPGVAEGKN
jgi:hypothetical protein